MQYINPDKATFLAVRLAELCHQSSPLADRIIHLRQLLEQLYKAVTEDERQSFTGLFARMQSANEKLNVGNELAGLSNQLRILCNKVAHEEVKELSSNDLDQGISTVYRLLQAFCPGFVNSHLESYLSSKTIISKVHLPQAAKQSFLCVADSWDVQENTLVLEVIREDGSFCTIRLNNDSSQPGHDGRLWTLLSRSLWRYAVLHCHNLTEVSGRSDSFMSNPLTLIVLEPDFLIDASALAACFGSNSADPVLFILNHLFQDSSGEAKLQGSMVNSIFDELVFEADKDYLELFKKGLAALPLAMVSLGKEAAIGIYNRIFAEHLPQLKAFIATLKEAEVLLEPSYLCPDYGLQGRLDLLAKEGNKYRIVELKSGKAPSTDIWTAHQMQVIAYNMIIRHAYGASRVSNASILYSVSKENSLRHVVNISILEQDLLMCRNRILGIMHLLAETPDKFFDWLKKANLSKSNPIAKSKYEQFTSLCAAMESYEWEWFIAAVQRVVREIWAVKTGENGSQGDNSFGHNALWQQGKAEKKAGYKLIADLKPLSYDKKLIRFAIPYTDEITDFREGDIVVLYEQSTSVTKQEIMRGVILSLNPDSLELSVRGGLKNDKRLSEHSLWALEHDTLESSLYSPLSSLTGFLCSPKHKRRLFMGLQQPSPGLDAEAETEEVEGILRRMQAANDLFIVQGPPGTGKTSGLLSAYISNLHHNSDKNILVLSFTNRAVDEICLCLQRREVPFIRTGASSAIEANLLSSLINGKRFEEMESIIRTNRIWIATVQSANAWYRDLQKLLSFDEIIVDEASQIIESGILGIISQAPKTILIGDQNQLPPITVQGSLPFSFDHPDLQSLAYGSYSQSLMERLQKVLSQNSGASSLAMLRRHYRMHESIAGLISEYYDNKLVAALESQTAVLQSDPQLPDWLNQRLLFIDCPPSSELHYDPLQVKLIGLILNKLLCQAAIKDPGTDLGIVAPFRAMIHSLKKELSGLNAVFSAITIDTVERFQGSEREIIIICLPIRHESDLLQISSLSEDGRIDRKLNVAVSRAKQRLIILGNLALCRKSVHYSKLIDKIAEGGILTDSGSVERDLLQ